MPNEVGAKSAQRVPFSPFISLHGVATTCTRLKVRQHWDALGSKIKQRFLSQLSPNMPLQRTVTRQRARAAAELRR